jgi:non-reducing end alpha-L-arabinofuranosidase
MRNQLFGLFALASALTLSGCSSSTSSNPSGGNSAGAGGSSSSGGAGKGGSSSLSPGSQGGSSKSSSSAGGGSAPSCANGTDCGGDLNGTWNVKSSCLALSGDMDIELSALACKTVAVTGELKVTGSWSAANGKYTDDTTTTGVVSFKLEKKCLSISGVPATCDNAATILQPLGWSDPSCPSNADGGCDCTLKTSQKGGIGVISAWADTRGDYSATGGSLTVDDRVDYSYCVDSNKLTLSPKRNVLPLSGTIVLEKSGGGGTGGTGGTASSGKAGATASSASGAGGVTTGGGKAGNTVGGAGGTGSPGGVTTSGGNKAGTTTSGSTGAAGSTGSGSAPCDIFKSAGNDCITAHSTVRALFGSYSGKLYQLRKSGTTKDINTLSPGGFADAAAHEAFCTGGSCELLYIYDQSGHDINLTWQAKDSPAPVGPVQGNNKAPNASKEKLTVNGNTVYSAYIDAGTAMWSDGSKKGLPLGKEPQGIYMVTSGTHVNTGCCFDYGQGETTRKVESCGSMDAMYFGTSCWFGGCSGSGPWVEHDPECGIYPGGGSAWPSTQKAFPNKYVTAMLKNDGATLKLKGADATTGTLTTVYSGKPAFTPDKRGGVVLGSGGDCCYSNSNASIGTLYEGAIVKGYPSDATDEAIQANIVAVKYGAQ